MSGTFCRSPRTIARRFEFELIKSKINSWGASLKSNSSVRSRSNLEPKLEPKVRFQAKFKIKSKVESQIQSVVKSKVKYSLHFFLIFDCLTHGPPSSTELFLCYPPQVMQKLVQKFLESFQKPIALLWRAIPERAASIFKSGIAPYHFLVCLGARPESQTLTNSF